MGDVKHKLFADIFYNLSEEEEQRTALVCGSESYTYGDLNHAISICASDLIDLGIGMGDHVGIYSFNSANVIIAYFAIIRIGAVAVMGNYSMSKDEICQLFRMTDTTWLVYGNTLLTKQDSSLIYKIAQDVDILQSNLFDITDSKVSFQDRRTENVANLHEIEARIARDTGKRTAHIIFTTGTTSKPKAVQGHQLGLLINTGRDILCRQGERGDNIVVSLPLFHIFGLYMIIDYFLTNGTVYLAQKVGADSIINLAGQNEVTDIATVAAVHLGVIEHKDFNCIKDKVRHLITAGSMVTSVQYLKIETSYSDAKMFNLYGQTETHGNVTFSRTEDSFEQRVFSVGKPFDSNEVRILGDGKMDSSGRVIGEVVIKNDTLMNGYYGLSTEEQAIYADGWLHTGDLGYENEQGYIYLVGRIKDIIIKNGENISPFEIENEIIKHSSVKDVKVYGASHMISGEIIVCFILCREGSTFDEKELRDFLKKNISRSKIPDEFFVFDEFPIAPNGKLDQKKLKYQMMERLNERIIRRALVEGYCVSEITIKNAKYLITSVVAMIESIALNIGMNQTKASKAALTVEEFLTERIINAYNEVGDITIKCILKENEMQVQFSDSGECYDIEKSKKSSYCAKIISKYSDSFLSMNSKKGFEYYLGFNYDEELKIEKFF